MRRRSLFHGFTAWLYATTAAATPVPVRRADGGGTVGAAWDVTPPGYVRVFHDDFTPVDGRRDGYRAWQGIDRSKWKVKGERFEATDGARVAGHIHTDASHVLIRPPHGLHLYGGRDAARRGAGYPLADADRRLGEVATREPVFRVPTAGKGPSLLRVRSPWENPPFYAKHVWVFGRWKRHSLGAATYEFGWEIDLESAAVRYDADTRTLAAHLNFHLWERLHDDRTRWPWWKTMRSVQHVRKTVVALPRDPSAPLTFEVRWGRGDDLFDPTRTFLEWWIEDVATGEMRRRYHVSPQSHLRARHRDPRWGYTDDAAHPTRQVPLPPELAAVAAEPGARPNWFRTAAAAATLGVDPREHPRWRPYHALGDRLTRPYSAVADPGRTWLTDFAEILVPDHPGNVVLTGGFQGDDFFLQQDPGRPTLAPYVDHPTHIDGVHAVASPIAGVAVFEPR
jgi:hypothetical protein